MKDPEIYSHISNLIFIDPQISSDAKLIMLTLSYGVFVLHQNFDQFQIMQFTGLSEEKLVLSMTEAARKMREIKSKIRK